MTPSLEVKTTMILNFPFKIVHTVLSDNKSHYLHFIKYIVEN